MSIGLILLCGVLTLLARAATPFLNHYQTQISALLSDKLGTPVSIENIQARWWGLSPSMRLFGLTLGQDEQKLSLKSAELDFDFRTFWHHSLADSLRLNVQGLNIRLVRESNGQLRLAGLGNNSDRKVGDTNANKPLIPLPNHMLFTNARLIWEDRQLEAPPLVIENLTLLSDRNDEHLKIAARLETNEGDAYFVANLTGHIRRMDWQGSSYMRVQGLNLADIINPHLPERFKLESGYLDTEAWADWQQARMVGMQGHLGVDHLQFQNEQLAALMVDSAHTDYRVEETDDGWRGILKAFNLRLPENTWPSSDIIFKRANKAEQDKLELQVSHVAISDIANAAQSLLEDPQLAETLRKARPHGEFSDSFVSIDFSNNDWLVRTQFDRLSSLPVDQLPSITNLHGELIASPKLTSLKLDTQDAAFLSPGFFRQPLAITKLNGTLQWEKLTSGWQLSSQKLQLETPHLKTVSRLHYIDTQVQPRFLDMQTDILHAQAKHTGLYLSPKVMSDGLIEFLDQGLKSGHADSGSFLFHGPIDDFAFSKTLSGQFEVIANTQDVDLQYHEQLPIAEKLDARLYFYRNSMQIDAHSGKLMNSELTKARATVNSLDPISPLLLQGTLQGPLSDVHTLLSQPPLGERFSDIGKLSKVKGNSELALDIYVPLSSKRHKALNVDAQLAFRNSRIQLPDWDIDLQKINGTLSLKNDVIRAKNIKARFEKQPISVDVKPGNKHNTLIVGRSTVSKDLLNKRFPELALPFVKGKTPATIQIDIAHKSTLPSVRSLHFSSDLKGLKVDLPAPFGKTASAKKHLDIHIPIARKNASHNIRYASLLNANFSPDWQHADIVVGSGKPQRPGKGLKIHGKLNDLDLADWLDGLPTEGAPSPKKAISVDLALTGIQHESTDLPNTQLQLQNQANTWRGSIKNDLISGNFSIPFDTSTQPINIRLDKIKLVLDTENNHDTPASPVPDPSSGPDPRDLPAINFQCADLSINNAKLGSLNAQITQVPQGLSFNNIQLTGEHGKVSGSGNWLHSDNGINTSVQAQADIKDFGSLLEQLGYGRPMEQANATLDVNANWPGNPMQLHLKTLELTSNVALSKGQLVEVEPGVARLTGLLSLSALTRRLRLDFSDVFDKGLSFDDIKGSFLIKDGNARTNNLKLSGPSTRIAFNGRIGLIDEDIDQHLIVHPNLDGTLSLAGTLISGPAAGVAIYVAQKIAPKQVDKLNRFEYSVKGNWHEPEIKQLESGGIISKLLKPFTDPEETTNTDAEIINDQH